MSRTDVWAQSDAENQRIWPPLSFVFRADSDDDVCLATLVAGADDGDIGSVWIEDRMG